MMIEEARKMRIGSSPPNASWLVAENFYCKTSFSIVVKAPRS
jgi:hypothetical protein